jgi:hypothetical protein
MSKDKMRAIERRKINFLIVGFQKGIFVGTNNIPLVFLSWEWVRRVS